MDPGSFSWREIMPVLTSIGMGIAVIASMRSEVKHLRKDLQDIKDANSREETARLAGDEANRTKIDTETRQLQSKIEGETRLLQSKIEGESASRQSEFVKLLERSHDSVTEFKDDLAKSREEIREALTEHRHEITTDLSKSRETWASIIEQLGRIRTLCDSNHRRAI